MWNSVLLTVHFFVLHVRYTAGNHPLSGSAWRYLWNYCLKYFENIPHTLSFGLWWMSSYWTQTCMVLKVWLTVALKICYTLSFFGEPKNCAHTCILLLKFQTLGFYPQSFWLGRPKVGPWSLQYKYGFSPVSHFLLILFVTGKLTTALLEILISLANKLGLLKTILPIEIICPVKVFKNLCKIFEVVI